MRQRKFFFFAIGAGILATAGVLWFSVRTMSGRLPRPQVYHASKPLVVVPRATEERPVIAERALLPPSVNLAVPFTSQAPHKNWDMPYQEFCEEASMLMAASYIRGEQITSPDDADTRLHAVSDFVSKELGYSADMTAAETAEVLKQYYKMDSVDVVSDPTIDQIKRALADGKVVLMPAAGRQLGNPYYRSPGPVYHMLVIKGYTNDGKFITNDPGTRRGADYLYNTETLMRAMHDWNNGNVEEGDKVVIIIG